MNKKVLIVATTFLLIILSSIFLFGFGGDIEITGGEEIQQIQIAEVIEASSYDYNTLINVFNHPVTITIEEHHSPYWFISPGTDIYYATLGLTYSNGYIFIRKTIEDWVGPEILLQPLLTEVTQHELGHIVHCALSKNDSARFWEDWRRTVDPSETVDWNLDIWMQSPYESFAEHFKYYTTPDEYIFYKEIRTNNGICTEEEFLDFLERWIKQKVYFSDVQPDFWAYKEINYTYEKQVMFGYTNGTFGPFDSLTKRHVFLIATRMGLNPPFSWETNYSTATRGEVHSTLPMLQFDSERWDEPLLRAQFAALYYRLCNK